MSPDDVEESISTAGDFGRSIHAHPTKHRRGKTSRSRKKRRHWKYFSRWRTGDSDDDDDIELYLWSKSRGLTSRTLPPTPAQPLKPAMPQGRAKVPTEVTETRSAVMIRTQRTVETLKRTSSTSDISIMQEAIFLTKLCASIMDKKLFISQSSEISKESEEITKKVPEGSDRRKEHKTSPSVARKLVNRTRSANNPKKANEVESITEKTKRTSSLPSIENSSMPSGDQETNGSSKEPLQIKKLLSTRNGSATSSTKSAPLPKKEWSANVENDILRLYETSAPIQGSSLVCSWASPSLPSNNRNTTSATSDFVQVIDKKVEKAEHTPSYVQVLAKMFKSRMQLRKERERMENDIKKSRQARDVVSGGRNESATYNDETPLSSTTQNPTAPTIVSFAHLRYRHQNDDVQASGFERRSRQRISTTENHQHFSNSVRVEPLQRHRVINQSNSKSDDLDVPYLQRQDGSCDEAGSTVAQDGRRSLNSLAVRLEHETRSRTDDAPCFKLSVSNDVSRVYKPKTILSPGNDITSDSNSPQSLARKARQCLLSNARLKYGEKERKNDSAQTSSDAGVLSRVVATNARHKSEVEVRWPASVGSLYFRPPAKIYYKGSVQKA